MWFMVAGIGMLLFRLKMNNGNGDSQLSYTKYRKHKTSAKERSLQEGETPERVFPSKYFPQLF
jgi:hypothetical protein